MIPNQDALPGRVWAPLHSNVPLALILASICPKIGDLKNVNNGVLSLILPSPGHQIILLNHSFRNRLSIGADGNFKLQNRIIPGASLSLGPGWAYFVAALAYRSFVDSQGLQTEDSEQSTCTPLKVLSNIDVHM